MENARHKPILEGVAETLLIPLLARASETQRPDCLIQDDRALELVKRLDFDFRRMRLHGHDEVALILRVRHFDEVCRSFLLRNPDGSVIHIGCGLDTRFDRLDNGRVHWYDLDLPEVIGLRSKLIPVDNPRYHLISGSVFSLQWMDAMAREMDQPILFCAEGVLPYFPGEQVKGLIQALRESFPGSELVCDAQTPFLIRMDNLQLAFTGVKARLHWGLDHPADIETWGQGIKLLDEWYYFNDPEPRAARYNWMGKIKALAKAAGIYHYRLGELG